MYQSYQLIGYQTPTLQLDPGDLVNLDDYANLIGDLKTNEGWLSSVQNGDMKKRLARLIGVVEQARALQGQQVSNDQTTLKVFLVPEFYFRPKANQGVQYSYSDVERDALVKVLDQYVKAARFKHWLFVFGTVIWQIQVNKLMTNAQLPVGVKLDDNKAQAYVIKNTTLIGHGGIKLATFDKAEYSPIDGIDTQYWAYYKDGLATNLKDAFELVIDESVKKLNYSERKQALAAYGEAIKAYLGQGLSNKMNGLINFNNCIKIGIEVCLDHEKNFLYDAITGYCKLNNADSFDLDMQLLISCGMTVHAENLLIGRGQAILRNDGQVDLDEKPRARVEASRVINDGGNKNKINGDRVAAGYPELTDNGAQYTADNKISETVVLAKAYKMPPLAGEFDIMKHGTTDLTGNKATMDVLHPQKLIVFASQPIKEPLP